MSQLSTLIESLEKKFPGATLSRHEDYGDSTLVVSPASLYDLLRFLRDNPESPFDLLLDICGVDYPEKSPRFEVVYHLYSLPTHHRLRVKTGLPAENPSVRSVISLWETANWFEREAFDMFGIRFEGHPNLKRLLMWEEFEGYPLRKDYPMQKRQPIPKAADLLLD